MIRDTVTAWPLYWPPGWTRTQYPERSRFGGCTVYGSVQGILAELGRMGVDEIVISTNQRLKPNGTPYSTGPKILDHGAAVWFTQSGEERVLACDRWSALADNLHAIELHIGAIRGQARWGVGSAQQAFAGFVALPEASGGEA